MNTNRTDFLRAAGTGAAFLSLNGVNEASAEAVRPEDWESYFPNPPRVHGGLDQGLFESMHDDTELP